MIWSYSLVVWTGISNVNRKMVCAYSLLWLRHFLYYTKIWIYSDTGRHTIWPDIYLLPGRAIPSVHQHQREEQLHEVCDTWWAPLGERWKHPAACPSLLAEHVIIWQDKASECVFGHFHKPSGIHPAATEAAALSEFYPMKVQNNCHELPPSQYWETDRILDGPTKLQ